MNVIPPVRPLRCALLASAICLQAAAAGAQAADPPPRGAQAAAGAANDLDEFMARVLERREETWRTLHDYVLDEAEQFRVLGPGGVPLHGMQREFSWYVRDGFFVRSPVRFDGVTLGEDDRRTYERRWLEQEKKREERAAKEADSAGPPAKADQRTPSAVPGEASLQDFVDQRGEPRFVSEAYFLRFRFEPGNYYFAGRETIDGRAVVKIEYYPTRLFADDHQEQSRSGRRGAKAEDQPAVKRGRPDKERQQEDDYDRQFNKVALVTLWIDPVERQIVRYVFENMDFGFLPGRWLVRLDTMGASMAMVRVLDGVWLPASIELQGGLSLASGSYQLRYERRFSGYRRAETSARIRDFAPRDR